MIISSPKQFRFDTVPGNYETFVFGYGQTRTRRVRLLLFRRTILLIAVGHTSRVIIFRSRDVIARRRRPAVVVFTAFLFTFFKRRRRRYIDFSKKNIVLGLWVGEGRWLGVNATKNRFFPQTDRRATSYTPRVNYFSNFRTSVYMCVCEGVKRGVVDRE